MISKDVHENGAKRQKKLGNQLDDGSIEQFNVKLFVSYKFCQLI